MKSKFVCFFYILISECAVSGFHCIKEVSCSLQRNLSSINSSHRVSSIICSTWSTLTVGLLMMFCALTPILRTPFVSSLTLSLGDKDSSSWMEEGRLLTYVVGSGFQNQRACSSLDHSILLPSRGHFLLRRLWASGLIGSPLWELFSPYGRNFRGFPRNCLASLRPCCCCCWRVKIYCGPKISVSSLLFLAYGI